MALSTFIVFVFCVIEDWLADKQLRQRGPKPTMNDSEVLTMEVIGEFLGMDEVRTKPSIPTFGATGRTGSHALRRCIARRLCGRPPTYGQ